MYIHIKNRDRYIKYTKNMATFVKWRFKAYSLQTLQTYSFANFHYDFFNELGKN